MQAGSSTLSKTNKLTLSILSTSAPFDSSNSTICKCPWMAAICKEVLPSYINNICNM